MDCMTIHLFPYTVLAVAQLSVINFLCLYNFLVLLPNACFIVDPSLILVSSDNVCALIVVNWTGFLLSLK